MGGAEHGSERSEGDSVRFRDLHVTTIHVAANFVNVDAASNCWRVVA
jgi:hypothetical protein